MPYDKKFYESFFEDKSEINLEKVKNHNLDIENSIKEEFLKKALSKLDDVLNVSETDKSFDIVVYSGGVYSFREFKNITLPVKNEMKKRKFKIKYVHPYGKFGPFALRIYGW